MSAGSDQSQLSPRAIQGNVLFSAANHFFVEAAMTLSDPGTVLPLFVRALGGSSFLAGLLPSLRWFGWMAPQFFVAGRLQRLTRYLPAVRLLELVRCTVYLILAACTLIWSRQYPELVLGIFFVLFPISRVAAGSSAVARNEVVARIVPVAKRAQVVSLRRLTGGIAGFLSGFAVRSVLSEQGTFFSLRCALLLGLSGLSFGIALLIWFGVKEPSLAIPAVERSLSEQLRRMPSILKSDSGYRVYLGVRALATGLTLASPFYILYATEVLHAPAAMAGIYIAARTLASIASNDFWGRQWRARGANWVQRASCALGVVSPLLVVGIALIRGNGAPGSSTVAVWLFALVFLIQGLASSASGLGQVAILYEISPEHDRPTYYGMANTILGPLYFLPAVGGALLGMVGYVPIFLLAGGMLALAYALAGRLEQRRAPEGGHSEI